MRFKFLKLLILTIVLLISQSKKPDDKEIWRFQCESGVIDDPDCPIDGGWTPWSQWSACEGFCDQIGHKTRKRECTNPPPSRGGAACSGPDEHTETCHITNCTTSEFRLLIEGDSARTEAIRQLETVPALRDHCLPAECTFEAIEAALSVDNTWQLNPENVWNSLLCVKYNIGCPVVGEWGVWGEWSSCGARCGIGKKWRLRRCDTPSPSEVRYICYGSPLDTEVCEGDQCAIERRNTSGAWSKWGKWSMCSETCGVGVKRRRRNCLENHTSLVSGSWGTHCRGQHDEIRECKNRRCTLNGGWSGWGDWGPCSKTCGAGKRSRSRSCTRPIPSGGGTACAGPKTEVGSCYLAPCDVYTHIIGLFTGNSYLQYSFGKKMTTTLIHFYIRFMPLSPQGTLVRRGHLNDSYIRLNIQKWHICVHAVVPNKYCNIPKICSHNAIEPAVWHTAMVTLTTNSIKLRFDDSLTSIENKFSCNTGLTKSNIYLFVGEKFYGEIQEVIFNFTPLHIRVDKEHAAVKSDLVPAVASNVLHERANLDEGFVSFDKEFFFRIPCFANPDEWQIELTLKPKKEYGTVLFIDGKNQWLYISLQNSRLRVKLALGDYRSESISATECPKDQWLDVTVSKLIDANSIVTIINGGERLHVLVDPNIDCKRYKPQEKCDDVLLHSDGYKSGYWVGYTKLELCVHEYFVGGVPSEVKKKVPEIFTPFYGTIASISVNTILYNLHDLSQERHKSNRIQLYSRTASVSDFYRETYWGQSNHLNLSCLHARKIRLYNYANWLSLDTGLFKFRDFDTHHYGPDRVLRLAVKADKDLRGFYTCRCYSGKSTRNIITYGVIGKTRDKLSGPDTTTTAAVFTTLTLVACTLLWLFAEVIRDLREGHGFFRDIQLTPEHEARAITDFIDENQDMYESPSVAAVHKARAQRNARTRISDSNHAAHESQGPQQETGFNRNNALSEQDLPTLPESTSLQVEVRRNLFTFEPNYISTPQHGSITSPRKKLTSSSSMEMVSPRVLCSRIISAKRRLSSHDSGTSHKKQVCSSSIIRQTRSNIGKSVIAKKKEAENILNMFRRLQTDL